MSTSFYTLQIQLVQSNSTKFYGHFSSVDDAMLSAKSYSSIPTLNKMIGMNEALATKQGDIQILEETSSKNNESVRTLTLSIKSVGYIMTSNTVWAKITPVGIVCDDKTKEEELVSEIKSSKSTLTLIDQESSKYAQDYRLVQQEIAQVLAKKFSKTNTSEDQTVPDPDTKECYMYQFVMKDYSSNDALALITYICKNKNHLAFKSRRECEGEGISATNVYKLMIWVNENDVIAMNEQDVQDVEAFINEQKAEIVFKGSKAF